MYIFTYIYIYIYILYIYIKIIYNKIVFLKCSMHTTCYSVILSFLLETLVHCCVCLLGTWNTFGKELCGVV